MSKLLIYHKSDLILEFPITAMETKLGAGKNNNIRFLAPGFSDQQCKINKVETSYILTDLAGDKRTLLNGQPALADKVHNDDRITLADFAIVCKLDLMDSLVDVMLNQMTGGAHGGKPGATENQPRAHSTELCHVTVIDDKHVQIELLDPERKVPLVKQNPALVKNPLVITAIVLVFGVLILLGLFLASSQPASE